MFQCKVTPCPDFSTVPLTAEHKLGLSNRTGEPSALKERRTIVCHPVMDTFLASRSEGRAGERSVLISWHCCHHRQRCYRRTPKNSSQEMPGLQTRLCWVKMAQLDACQKMWCHLGRTWVVPCLGAGCVCPLSGVCIGHLSSFSCSWNKFGSAGGTHSTHRLWDLVWTHSGLREGVSSGALGNLLSLEMRETLQH